MLNEENGWREWMDRSKGGRAVIGSILEREKKSPQVASMEERKRRYRETRSPSKAQEWDKEPTWLQAAASHKTKERTEGTSCQWWSPGKD